MMVATMMCLLSNFMGYLVLKICIDQIREEAFWAFIDVHVFVKLPRGFNDFNPV